MFSLLPTGPGSASRTTTALSSRDTRVCGTGWAWPYTSPTPTVLAAKQQREPQRLIRRYLLKHVVIDPGMAREVQEIVDETDNRPMRVLGYRTSAEAFTDEPLNLQTQQGLHLQVESG